MASKTTIDFSFLGPGECMECMVKVVKPFYAIKYSRYILCNGCKDVLDTGPLLR